MARQKQRDITPLWDASIGQLINATREKWQEVSPWMSEAEQLLRFASELLAQDGERMKSSRYALLVDKIAKCAINKP